MMKFYTSRAFASYMLCVCALLTGCATVKPEPVIVTQKEYVVRIPPKDLIELPPPVPKMDLNDQGDVSKWIVLEMERMTQLENQIKGIASFLIEEQQQSNK